MTITGRTSCAVIDRTLLVSTLIVCASVALLIGVPRSPAPGVDEVVTAFDAQADGIARDGFAPAADALATDPFARCADDDESVEGLDAAIAALPCATPSVDEAWERVGFQTQPWYSVHRPSRTSWDPSSNPARIIGSTRVQRRRRRDNVSHVGQDRPIARVTAPVILCADRHSQSLVAPQLGSTTADASDILSDRAPPR